MKPTATIVGNLGQDPDLRSSASGMAVCNFSVAVTERKKDGNEWVDGATTWWNCVAFGTKAERCAEVLRKGMKVIAYGNPSLEEWEDKQSGAKRAKAKLVVEEVGELIWGKAGGGTKGVPAAASDDEW